MPFEETIDLEGERSSVSIGYVGYQPVKYFVKKDSPLLTVDSQGLCVSHDDQFVSTLSWFVKVMFPQPSGPAFQLPRVIIGPSSLANLVIRLTDSVKVRLHICQVSQVVYLFSEN